MQIWNNLKNIFNNLKEWFALLGIFKQLGFVALLAFIVVLFSSLFIGSIENSYLIFIDSSTLPLMKDNPITLIYSFFLMMLGIVITGFVISIMSAWLENIIRDIRGGRLDYHGQNHTLIVNYNSKIETILEELEILHQNHRGIHDVVVLLGDEKNVEKLQQHLKITKYKSIRTFIRFGNVLEYERYETISILNIYSIIILSDDNIRDAFVRDNNSVRIANLLMSKKEFELYLKQKRSDQKPVKAIIELSNNLHLNTIIEQSTQKLFLPLAPLEILSNILNLSMINIDFYNIWTKLLSFDGHALYFINPAEHNLITKTYRDVVLSHERGLLIGLSRSVLGHFEIMLNALDETILENDWLLFIAKDSTQISFKTHACNDESHVQIEQPKEIFIKNILVIGNKREIHPNELLDMKYSSLKVIDPPIESLFFKEFFDDLLSDTGTSIDTIILNIEDELLYRITLNLKLFYSDEVLEKFVFLIDDAIIAEHLKHSGVKHTILSELLISKYITQVSNQISLYRVFNLLFAKENAEINLVEVKKLEPKLLENTQTLKHALAYNNMTYLGVINKQREVLFEADIVADAEKIIVLSNGDF